MESEVVSRAVPSPQSISKLLALPSWNVFKVTVKGEPPAVEFAVNASPVTAVFLITFKASSFRSSILSLTLVELLNVFNAAGAV